MTSLDPRFSSLFYDCRSMDSIRAVASIVALMLWCSLTAHRAFCQDYPNKPIRIFAGGAGGSADFAARLIAHGITGPLGQPVVVENRPSAITPSIVAKSPPDGYTIHVTGTVALVAPFISKVTYDPAKDFTPITVAATSPLVLVVHPSVPAKSVRELLALAKARPGQLNWATASVGGSAYLSAELFKSMSGVNIVSVPYKGAAPALSDTISGELQILFSNDDSLETYLKQGRLRALAVTSAASSLLYPGLPPIAATLPGYESASILGLWAPAGTPMPIIIRLNEEIVRFLNRQEVREEFLSIGTEVVASSPRQFADLIKSEMTKWGKVIKNAGLTVQ